MNDFTHTNKKKTYMNKYSFWQFFYLLQQYLVIEKPLWVKKKRWSFLNSNKNQIKLQSSGSCNTLGKLFELSFFFHPVYRFSHYSNNNKNNKNNIFPSHEIFAINEWTKYYSTNYLSTVAAHSQSNSPILPPSPSLLCLSPASVMFHGSAVRISTNTAYGICFRCTFYWHLI